MSRKLTDEELLAEIHRLAEDGDPPTQSDISEKAKFSLGPYRRRYDSWNNALREAGYEPNDTYGLSETALIRELRRLANKLGTAPTVAEMNGRGEYSHQPYVREFGTWNDALHAAGLDPRHRVNISDDELLTDLGRVVDELGRPPTFTELDDKSAFRATTYFDRFGSLHSALKEIDVQPPSPYEASASRLIGQLQAAKQDLGRPPIYREVGEVTDYSVSTYEREFGSWHKALDAAGIEPRGFEGENNPSWKGGHERYYGPNWPTQREKARERDGLCCQACGVSEEDHMRETGCELSVHHIKPLRSFKDNEEIDYDAANQLDNLVTLCRDCHRRWEGIPLRPQPA